MAKYSVIEISSRKDIRRFIEFPDWLYRDCPQYVPALHGDQMKSLTSCAPLRYSKRMLWIAYSNEDPAVLGRISGMINPRYNELYGKKRARFGWFDTIDDIEVARLLLETAEDWARSEGMTEIHGPLYYNTLGKQGMLVEGFENVPVFNVLYNYKYYNDFVTELGYVKECDWLELKMDAHEGAPEKLRRVSAALMERYNLHDGSIEALKKDPAKVKEFFEAYNESFAKGVYNFIPFDDEEVKEEAGTFLPFLNDRNSVVILDSDNHLVAFGITIPDISKALQKAKGHLFPFGWYHVMKALRNYETMDLMINGAVPKWQNTGISAVLHTKIGERYIANGTLWALSNPQIETNGAVNVWSRYGNDLYMRRRCYLKQL